MRIGYFGDGRWAHRALDRIACDGQFSVAFIVPRYGHQDPVLKRTASELGVEFFPLENVNEQASLRLLRGYEPDILVSMSFDQIFKHHILALAPQGAINCHAGALPFYRGRNVLNWALINDAPEFGVTVHYMDEGIDTGDIILQQTNPISDDDTYGTVLDRAVEVCAETLHSALQLLANGKAQLVKQASIHPVGFYTGRRIEGDEWIDWTWPSRRLYNFVRAITTPGPCARTALAGEEVRVVRAEMIPDAPTYIGTPGEVVGQDETGLRVKTGDSTIHVTDLRSESKLRIRVGSRFQSSTDVAIQHVSDRVAALERALDADRHTR